MSASIEMIDLRRRFALLALFGLLWMACLILVVQRLRTPLSDQHVSKQRDNRPPTVTPNPFVGVAGTVFTANGEPLAVNSEDMLNDRTRTKTSVALVADVVGSTPMAIALQPVLKGGIRDIVRTTPDGLVPAGRRLELSISKDFQHSLLSLADCFTGRSNGLPCTQALPATLLRADRRLDGDGSRLRAGMIAFVVVDEDSGAVLAKGGRLSDCAANSLRRKAIRQTDTTTPVFLGNEPCPQFPDVRHADWLGFTRPMDSKYIEMAKGSYLPEPDKKAPLLALDPSDWALNPGSTAKIQLAIACEKAHRFALNLDKDRSEFARSSHNDYFRKLALDCSNQYRAAYRRYAAPVRLLHPWDAWEKQKHQRSGFAFSPTPSELPDGPLMMSDRFIALAGTEAKKRGVKADFKTGEYAMLTNSRNLTSIALGDGGHRSYLISHVRTMRQLGLASRGKTSASAIYLVRDLDEPLPAEDLEGLSKTVAERALSLLSAVTQPNGTAHAACVRVYEKCPQGLSDVQGKTGTSDIADERIPAMLLKTSIGDPIPSKLFVGRFQVDRRWYTVAVSALRTRDLDGGLDKSNAAAEFGLLIQRELMMFGPGKR